MGPNLHIKVRLSPLVLHTDFRGKNEIANVSSNRMFLEPVPSRGARNKISVILESFIAKLQ